MENNEIKPQNKGFLKTSIAILITAIITALGTEIITKIGDGIVPEDKVIVKSIEDTLRIIYVEKVSEIDQGDNQLLIRLDRIENENTRMRREIINLSRKDILNKFVENEKTTNVKLDSRANNQKIGNQVFYDKSLSMQQYTKGDYQSFFSSDCPSINEDKLKIKFDIFNNEVIDNIAYVKVIIGKNYNKSGKLYFDTYFEQKYIPKAGENYIEIANDFPEGNFEIQYGFFLREDLKKELGHFYAKTCKVAK